MDLVSVIIPYYKKKKFISSTVNSAINQSYKNIEILIIYDDENHEDLKILKEIEKKMQGLRLLLIEKIWEQAFQETWEYLVQKGLI